GREMAEAWARGLDVGFVEARTEALPIETGTADLVIARLLLPYVRMAAAVREMARVLKTGGVALIQVHAFRYYWSNLLARRRSPAELAYYGRPLVAGVLFALTGRQPSHRWFRETALSVAGLERLCGRFGLAPVWRGGFRRKPIVAFRKERLTVDGKPRIRRDAIWNSGRQERKLSRASALPSWFPEFQIQSPFSIS
ncbi:MAG: class I SAM-dependent methyltransferase, partial [Lentisphaerae bacterium]|nr:class I SAM-dependent methyltransferase [Lentisphaerota bacterium]